MIKKEDSIVVTGFTSLLMWVWYTFVVGWFLSSGYGCWLNYWMWGCEKPQKAWLLCAVYVWVVVPPFENTVDINVHQNVAHLFIVQHGGGKPCSLLQQDLVCVTVKHLVVSEGGLLHANNKEFWLVRMCVSLAC